LIGLQGLLECGAGPKLNHHGGALRNDIGEIELDEHCGALKEGKIKGAMTDKEFDQAVYDLVNFMAYVAEPMALKRQTIGYYVLGFLLILFVFVYFLNREFWKDIH
jgi:ubiquinol-cytochrome c reductase cytochrome b subunit